MENTGACGIYHTIIILLSYYSLSFDKKIVKRRDSLDGCINTVTHMKTHTQSFDRTFIVPLSPCCSGRVAGLTMLFVVSRKNFSHFLGTSVSIPPSSTPATLKKTRGRNPRKSGNSIRISFTLDTSLCLKDNDSKGNSLLADLGKSQLQWRLYDRRSLIVLKCLLILHM